MQAFAAVDSTDQLVQVRIGRQQYIVKLQAKKSYGHHSPCLDCRSSDDHACECKAVLCDNVTIGSVGVAWSRGDLVTLIQSYMHTCVAAFEPWKKLMESLVVTHPNATVAVDHSMAHYLLAISVPFDSTHVIHVRVHGDSRIEDACIEYALTETTSLAVHLHTPTTIQVALAVLDRQRATRAAFLDALAHHLLLISFDSTHLNTLDCAVVHDQADAVCWIDIVRVTFAPTWGLVSTDAPLSSIQDAHTLSGRPLVSVVLVDAEGHHPLSIAPSDMDAFHANFIAPDASFFHSWLRHVLYARDNRPDDAVPPTRLPST